MLIKVGLQEWPRKAFPLSELPRLQAHRGYCQTGEKENTLGAFQTAAEYGFQMVEMDVHLSRDLVPVVFHDFDLSKAFSGSGRLHMRDTRLVSDVTSDELRELGVPSLYEVLTKSRVEYFNIELKTKLFSHWRFEEIVVDLVVNCGFSQRVLFSSFSPRTMHRLFQLTEDVPIAFLCEKWLPQYRHLVPFHCVHVSESNLDIQTLHELNADCVPISVWTVNSASRGRDLLREGVRSVISDSITPRLLGS